MAPEKSAPLPIAAIAASAERNLVRGTPCWSTSTTRTVRNSLSRISAATLLAASSCSSVCSPCLATNPAMPMPWSGFVRSFSCFTRPLCAARGRRVQTASSRSAG